MRDFSKVSPTVWRSQKFRRLTDIHERLIYLYLLTCPHGNSAGCFDLLPGYAAADLGMVEEQYLNRLDTVSKAGLIQFDRAENTVLITGWWKFNAPANVKHAQGILSQLSQASSHQLKLEAYQGIRENLITRKFDRDAAIHNALTTFDKQFAYGIPTETRDQDQTEKETKPRENLDLDHAQNSESLGNGSIATAIGRGELPSVKEGASKRLLQTSVMKRSHPND